MFRLDKSWYKSQTHQVRRQLQARVDQPGALRSLIRIPSWHPGQFLARVQAAASIRWLHQQSVSSLLCFFFGAAEGVGRTASSDVPRCVFHPLNESLCPNCFLGNRRKVSYVMTKQQLWLNVWFDCTRKYEWIFLKKFRKAVMSYESHALFNLGHCNFNDNLTQLTDEWENIKATIKLLKS